MVRPTSKSAIVTASGASCAGESFTWRRRLELACCFACAIGVPGILLWNRVKAEPTEAAANKEPLQQAFQAGKMM